MEWTTKPASAAAASSPPPLLWDWDAPADEAPAATQEAKRARADGAAGGAEAARCQVEGCGVGLAAAKEYHRKHRVCEAHTKCPRVVVDGQERRFCQQCSRFHALSEFDQKKRSCRRRLSDHNARRRKPQPDAFSFASAGLASSLFDDERQISFMWNNNLLSHARPFTYSSWDSLSGFKLSQVKEKEEKSKKAATVNGQDHLAKSHLSNAFPTFCHDIHGLLSIKGTEASGTASILDGGPNIQRALSLLSAGYWGSSDPVQQQASSLIQFTDANQHRTPPPSASNGGNSTSAFCIDGQPLAPDSQVVHFTMDASSNTLQDLQRIKRVYGSML